MSKSVRTLDLSRNGVDGDGVNSIELMLKTAPVLSTFALHKAGVESGQSVELEREPAPATTRPCGQD